MSLSVPQMQTVLAEYEDRRHEFRKWLQSQLVEGVHYGYPPGISKSNADPRRWKGKPSLYKAGAEFIVDLMGIRSAFSTDLDAWKMLGEPQGTFIRKCCLYSRANGELVGEGSGARKIGDKKMDINASLKMADKAAVVAAVINAYGLSDLFTQDLEDMDETDKPTIQGVTVKELKELRAEWNSRNPDDANDRGAFLAWCSSVTQVKMNVLDQPEGWKLVDLQACWAELER